MTMVEITTIDGGCILIKEIRKSKGLTQEELSKKSGVKREYISQIENNRNSPNLRTLQKLAKALGVKVSDLLEEN